MNIKNRKQQGFTIIEVLIVLAIAGLILLIVFLAVPALQRNSRNTQRKANVSAILGAVTEFTNNNNGTLPAVACGTASPYSLANGTCALPTGTTAQFNQGYYTNAPGNTLAAPGEGAIPSGALGPMTEDKVLLVRGAKCGTTAGVTVAGSTRQVAVLYMNEGSGTLVAACQDS